MTLLRTLGDILQPEEDNPYSKMVQTYKRDRDKKAKLTKLLNKKEDKLKDAEHFRSNGAALYFGEPTNKVISDLSEDINLIKKAREKFN